MFFQTTLLKQEIHGRIKKNKKDESTYADESISADVNRFVHTYTYKGKNKNGLEEIVSHLELKQIPKDHPANQFKLQFQKTFKSKVKKSQGRVLFDNKAGRMQSSHTQFIGDFTNISKESTVLSKSAMTRTLNLVEPETEGK